MRRNLFHKSLLKYEIYVIGKLISFPVREEMFAEDNSLLYCVLLVYNKFLTKV